MPQALVAICEATTVIDSEGNPIEMAPEEPAEVEEVEETEAEGDENAEKE